MKKGRVRQRCNRLTNGHCAVDGAGDPNSLPLFRSDDVDCEISLHHPLYLLLPSNFFTFLSLGRWQNSATRQWWLMRVTSTVLPAHCYVCSSIVIVAALPYHFWINWCLLSEPTLHSSSNSYPDQPLVAVLWASVRRSSKHSTDSAVSLHHFIPSSSNIPQHTCTNHNRECGYLHQSFLYITTKYTSFTWRFE